MMRTDTLKSHVYPIRTEITVEKQIPIFHVCSMEDNNSNELLVSKNLSHVCSMEEDESKSIIVDENYTGESESE